MIPLQFAFIGLGLIGGSIAKAIKLSNANHNIIAYDHEAYTQDTNKKDSNDIEALSKDLSNALNSKVIDSIINDLTLLKDCNIIFLCAPVMANIQYLSLLKDIISPSTIITDVGSVKGYIHEEVGRLGLSKNFIGGHPMTGSEKSGFLYSDASMLENAFYILTPSIDIDKEKIALFIDLINEMKSIPILLDNKEHDNITAAISHLPHIIASSLVNLVEESDSDMEYMKLLAAGGFKDITRIASASPTIWQNISLTNSESILYYLEQYITSLSNIKVLLKEQSSSKLYDFFEQAKEYRDSLPKISKGHGIPIYEIYTDLQDVAGSIAKIATLLADHQISIRNIGIIHNREFQEGVLRIEFYQEQERENASYLLKKYNYTIYER